METYQIKLTGSGTKEAIAQSLRELADAIYHETSMGHGKNLSDETLENWEDATVIAEVNSL